MRLSQRIVDEINWDWMCRVVAAGDVPLLDGQNLTPEEWRELVQLTGRAVDRETGRVSLAALSGRDARTWRRLAGKAAGQTVSVAEWEAAA